MPGRPPGRSAPLVDGCLAGSVVAEADHPAAVRAYFEALNLEDWDNMARVWADLSELKAVGSRPRRGRENIVSYFRPLFEPWQAHREGPTRVVVAGDVVVAEIEFAGVTRGGREVVFDAVDVFDLEGDQIVRLSTWYDLAWVRAQL